MSACIIVKFVKDSGCDISNWIAIIVSFASLIFTICVTYRGEKREKKRTTIEALNVLQEQVFDNLNTYTFAEVKYIAQKWSEAIKEQNNYVKSKKGSSMEFYKYNTTYNEAILAYRKISGYIARIEHFSLGVNMGIYDARVVEKAATKYFISIHKKVFPIIDVKNKIGDNNVNNNIDKNNNENENSENKVNQSFYCEFDNLVEKLKKIEDDELKAKQKEDECKVKKEKKEVKSRRRKKTVKIKKRKR